MPGDRPDPRQGDVWRVEFHEGGERPALVVSRDALNRGRLVLVVPCTTSRVSERRATPNHVFLPAGTGGLGQDSVAQTHLVQPVAVEWLLARLGTLPAPALEETLLAVAWSIGLFENLARGIATPSP